MAVDKIEETFVASNEDDLRDHVNKAIRKGIDAADILATIQKSNGHWDEKYIRTQIEQALNEAEPAARADKNPYFASSPVNVTSRLSQLKMR
jgi:hypothetical protein